MRINHLTPTLEIRGPGPRAAVRGWIEWTLIGRDGKVKQAGEQHNLFLNKGLDRVMSTLHSTAAGTDRLDGVTQYVAVGTGSNVPAVTDTALQAEIARTNADLGLGSSYALTRLANGLWRISRTRAFDYNQANGNLTEFGGSESSSSANGVNTRELFRDGSNNPIVITKTSNERLAITYHLEIQLSPVVDTQAADINIVGLGTKQVSHLWVDNGDSVPDDIYAWVSTANGSPCVAMGMYTSSLTGAMVYSNSGAPNGNLNFTHYGAWLSYANGTYYRNYEGERGPEASDVSIYGYGYGYGNAGSSNINNRMGWKARFGVAGGAEAPILKNKDYRLKLAFRFSIARV